MPLFYESDIDVFLADFGLDGLLTSAAAGIKTIKVIFDNDFQQINIFDGGVESSGPQGIVKTTDVSGAIHGETLVIDNKAYYIRGIQPDGTGFTKFILSEN